MTVIGPWRRPKNSSADEAGGIHDNQTAQALGFEGGTIPGSVSMEQFTPLLTNYFGDQWWATGGLSVFLARPVFDNEPVRCILEPATDTKARVWMENRDGDIVVNGTASLGDDPFSEIKSRLQDNRKNPDLRMMADVVIGKPSPVCRVRITDEQVDERLPLITEPMECYASKNQFGQKVAPIEPYVHAFRGVEEHIIPINEAYVGMFGAIEVQYLSGPVTANTDYLCKGEVIALSASAKTEIVWYTATLSDAKNGREVARMTKMDRLLKSASPLWN
ncbi:MAG: hypothetical protein P8R02_01000 [Pseudomonadales bacterium]|nr:hypothetical protein [Pseudomonadales bacterium]